MNSAVPRVMLPVWVFARRNLMQLPSPVIDNHRVLLKKGASSASQASARIFLLQHPRLQREYFGIFRNYLDFLGMIWNED